MKLGKPPVVEVSIEFHFESSLGAAEWDFTRSVEFVDQFRTDYPETEVASQQQVVEIQKFARGTKPAFAGMRAPIAVRAFPTNRSRYLLNSKDLLRCIFVRSSEQDYQGFPALKAEAMAKLASYLEYFRPTKLLRFVVQYVDFFRIPVVNQHAELRDYLTICTEPDETIFGTTVGFRKAFTTKPPGSEDLLTCELYNVSVGKKEKSLETKEKSIGIPFRMEWGLHAFKDLSWEAEVLGERLQNAHDRLLRCFEVSFTKTGLALFEPENEAET